MLIQLGVGLMRACLIANNKAEQWRGGWTRVAGRVERALYGLLVAGFRKRPSDGRQNKGKVVAAAGLRAKKLQIWTSKPEVRGGDG